MIYALLQDKLLIVNPSDKKVVDVMTDTPGSSVCGSLAGEVPPSEPPRLAEREGVRTLSQPAERAITVLLELRF